MLGDGFSTSDLISDPENTAWEGRGGAGDVLPTCHLLQPRLGCQVPGASLIPVCRTALHSHWQDNRLSTLLGFQCPLQTCSKFHLQPVSLPLHIQQDFIIQAFPHLHTFRCASHCLEIPYVSLLIWTHTRPLKFTSVVRALWRLSLPKPAEDYSLVHSLNM